MNLFFYESSITARETPSTHYLNQKQAEINALWENGTQTIFNVLEQDDIGSQNYYPKDISVDSAIDIGTGYKKGDDFKVFSYRDITKSTPTGLMYKFNESYWIAINTSNIASPISSVEVRRCTNWLKWINPQNGKLNIIPCAVDYELSSPSPQRDKDVIVANGHCLVICQGNELTLGLEKNQRFVLNGQPFKLAAINNLQHDNIKTQSPTLLYLDMYLDIIDNDDDIINNIANATEDEYIIEIDTQISEQVKGFSSQMIAHVIYNGITVDRDIIWKGNENVLIDDDGNFELVGDVGNTAIIRAELVGNHTVYAVQQIEIVNDIENSYEIVINKEFSEIRTKESITFTAMLYRNGQKQNDVVNAYLGGFAIQNVTFEQGSELNQFTLTCNQLSQYPLIITFESGSTSKTIQIALKAYF